MSGPYGSDGIGPEGASAIAEALKGIERGVLTYMASYLALGTNRIGPEVAKALGGALAVNEVMTNLNLAGCKIGDEGAKAIGSALSRSMRCSPTPRPRRQPQIREQVAAAIAEALRCTWHQIARCCTRNKIARYRVLRGGEEQVAPILDLFSKCAGLRAKGLAALLGCCAALCAQAHTSTLSRNSANCPPIAPSHPHPKSKVQRTDLSSAPCHLLSCVHPYHVGVQSSELEQADIASREGGALLSTPHARGVRPPPAPSPHARTPPETRGQASGPLILRLISQHFREENHPLELHEP